MRASHGRVDRAESVRGAATCYPYRLAAQAIPMTDTDPLPPAPTLIQPQLDPAQARVLGCLLEKQALTPEVYPLTVNAAQTASNQKTSRDPIMQLEVGAVGHALRGLEDLKLVRVIHSARALRYEHRFDEVYGTTGRQRALLCLLLLRGPQTLNELYTRTDRLATFDSPEAVLETLERLSERSPPMAVCLGRAPGQREDRYMHLLSGPVSPGLMGTRGMAADDTAHAPGLSARVQELEAAVAALREELAGLRARIGDA